MPATSTGRSSTPSLRPKTRTPHNSGARQQRRRLQAHSWIHRSVVTSVRTTRDLPDLACVASAGSTLLSRVARAQSFSPGRLAEVLADPLRSFGHPILARGGASSRRSRRTGHLAAGDWITLTVLAVNHEIF